MKFTIATLLIFLIQTAQLSTVNTQAIQLSKAAAEPSAIDIDSFTTLSTNNRTVLAYITPWNNQGFQTALRHLHVFTHLSPVWFTIHIHNQDSKGKKVRINITGQHHINTTWIQSVKQQASNIRIVPRLLLDVSDIHAIKLMTVAKLQQSLLKKTLKVLNQYSMDGFVLDMQSDVYYILSQQPNSQQLRQQMNQLLIDWGLKLQSKQRQLILAVRPFFPSSPLFGADDFKMTRHAISYFSLMTYDYPASPSASLLERPQSPIQWFQQSLQVLMGEEGLNNLNVSQQVLAGLPLYGQHYSIKNTKVEAITEARYETLVEQSKNGLQRHLTEYVEDVFVSEDCVIYYPSMRFYAVRIQMARQLQCGIALWEIGQLKHKQLYQLLAS